MLCSKCGTDHDPSRPCPPAQESGRSASTEVVHPAAEPEPPSPPRIRPLTPPPALGPAARAGAAAIAKEFAAELAETIERLGPLHAPSGEPDPTIGTTIGSFKIVRRLGKGGMGTV